MPMNITEMRNNLRRLRLSGMTETLEARALQFAQESTPLMDAFGILLRDELDRRDTKAIDVRYRRSGLDEKKYRA